MYSYYGLEENKRSLAYGHIWVNRTKDNMKVRNPVNYVEKYLRKTIDVKNEKYLLSRAMTWLFSLRNYSNTRNLIYPLNYGAVSNNIWEAIFYIELKTDWLGFEPKKFIEWLNENDLGAG